MACVPNQQLLVDGAQNVDRMDGAFVLKPPVDAIDEFRIITLNAPAEFGGFAGSTTTVVTRGGGNKFHGTAYEFFRNDVLDARNFFSPSVEALKQNQFGVTAEGPIRKDRLFLFGYYEGFRNRQGITYTSTVPSLAERNGDFSALASPRSTMRKGATSTKLEAIPKFVQRHRREDRWFISGRERKSDHLHDHSGHTERRRSGGRPRGLECL